MTAMALVTVQRSPSVTCSTSERGSSSAPSTTVSSAGSSGGSASTGTGVTRSAGTGQDQRRGGRGGRGLRARSAAICGTSPSASPLPPRTGAAGSTTPSPAPTRSLSEFYYAGRGAAPSAPRPGCDIQQHLQAMFGLLRPQDTLKMAVRLESEHANRTRYLVVVSCMEESCLLGIDCSANSGCSIGLVLRVLANAAITLDGDGGFSVSVGGSHHIFKPVSVQAMWSALQTLYRVCSAARERNLFLVPGKDWAEYYEERVCSDRSCLNEWNAMDSLESRRPPSPGALRSKPSERCETEQVIRSTLKEIMMSVDLDEVTSKYIRGRLEEQLNMDLGELKSFIDGEMLTILGQMDAATEIFDHVYLGSEWNASNLEELQKNGVRHIVNVTREIDNFFPGMFNYLNVRVYDDEKTDLLKHWDDTFKYISRAREEGSKVLVHCKMGVSRSASVVIAYAMKAYNWDLKHAFSFVRERRTCIKPNTSFISQLETYQGILDAMKNREKLQRSKSETNLKSPGLVAKAEACSAPTSASASASALSTSASALPTSTIPDVRLPPPASTTVTTPSSHPSSSEPTTSPDRSTMSGAGGRPRSWSPSNSLANSLLGGCQPEWRERPLTSASMEHLNATGAGPGPPAPPPAPPPLPPPPKEVEARNVRLPCANGLAYSVSQNKAVHLSALATMPPPTSAIVTSPVSIPVPTPVPAPVTVPVSAPVPAPALTASQFTSVCRRPRPGPRPWHTSLPALPARTDPDDESVSLLSVSAPASASTAPPGKVRNLKKEFEAAAAAATAAAAAAAAAAVAGTAMSTPSLPPSPSPAPSPALCLDSRSVPSSPVARHCDTVPVSVLAEDSSVRVLVGKYEPTASQPPVPPRNTSVPRNLSAAARNPSNLLYNNIRNGWRPRVQAAPTVNAERLASVVAKAASKKQQQGKTHPLAQLGIGKVPPQVYNTM